MKDREMKQWIDEVRSRSDFIEDARAALSQSVEFATLAHAYAAAPSSMRKSALKQMSDFAVRFVVKREVIHER